MDRSPLVPYRLTICGLTELGQHAGAGVTHVLSILDPEHPDPDDFAAYPPHRRLLWRFHDVIAEQPGMVPPTQATVQAVLTFGEASRRQPIDHLLVHCHMGISRSTAAAAILLAQDNPGREVEVFAAIRTVRPRSWPNSRMIALADRMLDRGGALEDAMRGHHLAVATSFPDLARLLRQGERAHEVPADRDGCA